MTEKEAFEAWFAEKADTGYVQRVKSIALWAWQAAIAHERERCAELAKPQGEPVGSIMKGHTKQRAGPWCKEILLYSPDNTGDSPENRVMVYTHPAHTEDEVQLILRSNFSDPLFERTVRQTLGVPA